jgi:hypothetical protein
MSYTPCFCRPWWVVQAALCRESIDCAQAHRPPERYVHMLRDSLHWHRRI